ncbi:MAG: hypothetical protein HY897_21310 [Deltaproteobacteria bacterium]|nr:hypothetical protein [Deltaproteobacteria bacterium]
MSPAVLKIFRVLAIIGLALSVVVHVAALCGHMLMPMARAMIGLHLGIFVVFIPAVLATREDPTLRQWGRQSWWHLSVPLWAKIGVGVLMVVAAANFAYFAVTDRSSRHATSHRDSQERPVPLNPAVRWEKDLRTLRVFSGGWMVFYAAAALLLTHGLRRSKSPPGPSPRAILDSLPRAGGALPDVRRFPFGIRGKVVAASDATDPDAWLAGIATAAEGSGATVERAGPRAIRFEMGPLLSRKGARLALAMSDGGWIEIDNSGPRPVARFALRTVELLCWGSVAVAAAAVFMAIQWRGEEWRLLVAVPALWLFFVPGNLMIGRGEMQALLRRTAAAAIAARGPSSF